jgi:hypothetical protein
MTRSPDSAGLDPQTTLATLPDISLSLTELLASLRRTGRLLPLVQDALGEKVIQHAARQAGLAVSADELQQAANRFRQQRGLRSTEDTRAWLAQHGLRLIDLEAMLEQSLLTDALRNHSTAGRLEERFAANTDRYARARISHFGVASEGPTRTHARRHDMVNSDESWPATSERDAWIPRRRSSVRSRAIGA